MSLGLAWECLGLPQEELEEVSVERDVWPSLLSLRPPRDKSEDDEWRDACFSPTLKTILTSKCICYRKELGTGVYGLMREMSDAPISYTTDASAPEVKVGGWKYVGCSLSHQLPLISQIDPGAAPVSQPDDLPNFFSAMQTHQPPLSC
ncbi:hypothetical protein ATANTOWER_024108 [Ataeniobius toweri]|uniref:Uncharacterized protein n=1 Tax=Ataeniobius toweri TaxID=208326 RepID=A0ABU7A8N0_9TELE|nr:hypothetical protein [Ataeniobius toweri]